MTNEELEHYKALLQQEKMAIMRSLSEDDMAARDILENDANVVGDSADEASVNVTQNILNLTNNNNKQTLQGIEAALRRLQEGTYGLCVVCGVEINKERLDVLPWATMCIACKNEREKSQK